VPSALSYGCCGAWPWMAYVSSERSIQAYFSWICRRRVIRSTVGSSLA